MLSAIAQLRRCSLWKRAVPGLSQRCSRFFSSKDGSQGPQEHHVQIDRSELYQWDKQPAETELAKVKQPETEFIRYLKDFIKIRGPIPVAEYMREVLTNPKFGYYMNRDVFGEKGDFTTSPEISQLFGEMVGIWVYSNWLQLGKPAQFRLVEFGPGRGTLMADVLRTASQFPGFSSAVSIHFIEASPYLKDMQYTSLLKCLKQAVPQPLDRKDSVQINGTHVSWHPSLETIPAGPTVVLAHEFFDALPVYQFQYTKRGWAERLVDLDTSLESPYHFRYVLAPGSTPAVVTFMRRARNMNVAEGDSVEVCPAGVAVAHDIAKRVGQHKGAALLVDYGENRALAQSLQAIRAHKFVDVFDNPGSADLSAWVDFNSLRYAAQSSKAAVDIFGPVLQREFLMGLGIDIRLTELVKSVSDDEAERLFGEFMRLVDDQQMGKTFKVMAFASKGLRPEGFLAAQSNASPVQASSEPK